MVSSFPFMWTKTTMVTLKIHDNDRKRLNTSRTIVLPGSKIFEQNGEN